MIFAREVGAVDTATYSQINLVPTKVAFEELGKIKDTGVLIQKGRTEDVTHYKLKQISQVARNPPK